MIIILLIIYFSLFSLFKFEISISAIYILILKDFRTVTLRTDTTDWLTDTPTHRDASHLKIDLDAISDNMNNEGYLGMHGTV